MSNPDQTNIASLNKRYSTLNKAMYGLYILIVLLALIMVVSMLRGLPPLSIIPFAISAFLVNLLLKYLGKKKLVLIEKINKLKSKGN